MKISENIFNKKNKKLFYSILNVFREYTIVGIAYENNSVQGSMVLIYHFF